MRNLESNNPSILLNRYADAISLEDCEVKTQPDVSVEKLRLYDSKMISSLNWPNNPEGQYARKFLEPIIKNGITHYVENIHAEMFALKVRDFVFPVIVTTENYDNAYVCSPYGHYILYGKEYIGLIKNSILSAIVKSLLGCIGKISCAGRLNSVVYVNTWMFSTDLYPNGLSDDDLNDILNLLKERFPNHAIIFRSINKISTGSLMTGLKRLKFHLLPSRYVYFSDTKNESIFQTRILKSDLKLWRECTYEVLDEVKATSEDCAHFLELYDLLYFNNPSSHQPQFNTRFIHLLVDQGLLSFKVLKDKGRTVGMAGYFLRDGVMLCPLFGYDKNHPEHAKIYRILSTALLLEAKKQGAMFHQSAGASFYKQVRRAEGTFEYMAVYTHHLTTKQRFVWGLLRTFLNGIAPPFMKKY